MNIKKLIFHIFIIIIFFSCSGFSQSTVSFVHISDTHVGTPVSRDKLKALLEDINLLLRKPVFIINTGDITDMGTQEEFESYLQIINLSDVKIFSLIGNHDIRWSNVGKKRFESMIGPTYHSFDYGDIHFIFLDSGMLMEQYGHFSIVQLEWLKSDLAAVGKDRPIIICAHHPIFAEKRYIDNELELLQIINNYNVILYLCGHGHDNKSWKVNGIDVVMTKAVTSDESGYHVFEIYPTADICSFTREIKTKKTILEFKRQLKRPVLEKDYNFIAPNPKKFYDENLPVLLRVRTLKYPEVSLDGRHWIELEKKGGKYFQNLNIQHLSEGVHNLFFRYSSNENITWTDHIKFHIDRKSVQILYKVSLEAEIQASATGDNKSIFIGTNTGKLNCLDKNSGKIKWHFNTQEPITTTPAINEDTLFVTSSNGFCYALNKSSGKKIWQQRTGQAIFSSPNYLDHVVYFGSSDSNLYALNSKNGNILWQFKAGGHIKAKPAVTKKYVTFGAWDGYFYCLSSKQGTLIWHNKISDNLYFSAATSNPLILVDKVIVNSHDHTSYCFNLDDGSLLWKHENHENHKPGYSSPANFDDKMIMGSLSGHLFTLSENDGTAMWQTALADSADPVFDSSPVIHYPEVVVGTIGGVVYGVHINDGRKIWDCKLSDGYIFSTPFIKDDVIYIGSVDGNFYAIKKRK